MADSDSEPKAAGFRAAAPHVDAGDREERLETVLLRDDGFDAFPGVVPALYQTSLFTFDSFAGMRDTLSGKNDGYVYTRGRNPTVRGFEQKVALLEGAEDACAFASGMAAIASVILGNVAAGERIVCVRNVYPDAYKLMTRLLPRLGIETTFVDGSDTEAVIASLEGAGSAPRSAPDGSGGDGATGAAAGPVRLLYLESPTSQLFELQDIAALAQAARERGIVTVVDNSWATPLGQRPLAHGADVVLHSASKYLSGHSDVVAGVVAGKEPAIARLRQLELMVLGGKLSPFDAWLLQRGVRTLPLRLERHARSAAIVAEFLEKHPLVRRVHYPGLASHPRADLFRRYFEAASGLLSFELVDRCAGEETVEAFVDGLRLFRLGVSWGGYESLVYPILLSYLTAGENSSARAFEVPRSLIRLHVGLEDPDDLLADLTRAFAASEEAASQPAAARGENAM